MSSRLLRTTGIAAPSILTAAHQPSLLLLFQQRVSYDAYRLQGYRLAEIVRQSGVHYVTVSCRQKQVEDATV
jgi:hypothetical protein